MSDKTFSQILFDMIQALSLFFSKKATQMGRGQTTQMQKMYTKGMLRIGGVPFPHSLDECFAVLIHVEEFQSTRKRVRGCPPRTVAYVQAMFSLAEKMGVTVQYEHHHQNMN